MSANSHKKLGTNIKYWSLAESLDDFYKHLREFLWPFFFFFFFSACNCDRVGASDNLCDLQTGECSCRIKAGGRQCNLCPPRNWDFPACRPCRCNGHDTSNCHPRTGVCLDCQHNTAGKNCEVCATGYYGDATVGEYLETRAHPLYLPRFEVVFSWDPYWAHASWTASSLYFYLKTELHLRIASSFPTKKIETTRPLAVCSKKKSVFLRIQLLAIPFATNTYHFYHFCRLKH